MFESASKLATKSYPFNYIALSIILWDTKGLFSNSNDLPIALSFIILILISMGILSSSKNYDLLGSLKIIICIELILHLISFYHSPHSLYDFAKEIRDESFQFILLLTICLAWFVYLTLYHKNSLLLLILFFGAVFSGFYVYNTIDPDIDTFKFITIASQHFLDGENPYLFEYPDFYSGAYSSVYGNKYAFNYWPFCLYFCSLSKLIFHDIRYAFLFFQFIFVGSLFVFLERKHYTYSILFGLTWLLNPVVSFVNIQSWIDALIVPVFFISMQLLFHKKFKSSALLLGLAVSIKLYYLFAIPLILIYMYKLDKQKLLSFTIYLFAGFTLSFLPFLFNNFQGLFDSTILFFVNSQIRIDSISLVSYTKYLTNWDISRLGSILTLILYIGIIIRFYTKGNTIFELINTICISFLIIFLFSKQSFCNYYYFNIFLILISLYFQFLETKNTTIAQ